MTSEKETIRPYPKNAAVELIGGPCCGDLVLWNEGLVRACVWQNGVAEYRRESATKAVFHRQIP